jgi:hypothetical protein
MSHISVLIGVPVQGTMISLWRWTGMLLLLLWEIWLTNIEANTNM